MPSKHGKPRLSKGILEMKFMQRSKAKVAKELEVEEGLAMYSNEINEQMLNSTSNFIFEPSFKNCEGLIDGRLSFRGMNPEIERLLELERLEQQSKEKHDQLKEVSDDEMAAAIYFNRAPGASRTMHKKFQRKNHGKRKSSDNKRSDVKDNENPAGFNKKPKFKKPRVDDEI